MVRRKDVRGPNIIYTITIKIRIRFKMRNKTVILQLQCYNKFMQNVS